MRAAATIRVSVVRANPVGGWVSLGADVGACPASTDDVEARRQTQTAARAHPPPRR